MRIVRSIGNPPRTFEPLIERDNICTYGHLEPFPLRQGPPRRPVHRVQGVQRAAGKNMRIRGVKQVGSP